MAGYKILQVLPRLHQGGVENIVLSLNRGLVAAGFDSMVVSNGGALVDSIVADGGHHVCCDVATKNIFTAWHRARLLGQVIAQSRPDLVHVHSRVPAWLLRFAGSSVPVVSTVHGFHSNAWYSNILLRAGRVICPCQSLYDSMALAADGVRSRLRLVPCGVDSSVYDPGNISPQRCLALRSELGIGAGATVISMPARFSRRKGHELLLQAFSLLLEKWGGGAGKEGREGREGGAGRAGEDIVLLFAGDYAANPGLYASLQQQCLDYGVERQVLFVDSHSVVEVIAISDIVVSASLRPEGFGLTMVEAHSMNKPVVAAAHGGALDIVIPGANGELFQPLSAASLADGLDKVLAGIAAGRFSPDTMRTRVCSSFSVAAMLRGTISVYRELLS